MVPKKTPHNMDCEANYVMNTCSRAKLQCAFKMKAKGKTCVGDKAVITNKGKTITLCNKKGKYKATVTGDFSIRVSTDAKKGSKGGKCSIRCIKKGKPKPTTTTAAPTPPPTTGGASQTTTSTSGGGGGGGVGTQAQYCAIDSTHTMCLHQGPSEACTAKTVERDLTEAAKQALVDKHNELRRKVARGEETNGAQPAASLITTQPARRLTGSGWDRTSTCTAAATLRT